MAAVMKTSGLAGLLTGAVALGIAELTAAVTGPNGAPVTAVGETAINLTPVPVKEFAIAHFGTHDKAALITGIVVMLAAFGVLIGVLAVRRLAGSPRRRTRSAPRSRREARRSARDSARKRARLALRVPRAGSTTNSGTTCRARAHARCSAGLSCSRRSRVKTTIAVSI